MLSRVSSYCQTAAAKLAMTTTTLRTTSSLSSSSSSSLPLLLSSPQLPSTSMSVGDHRKSFGSTTLLEATTTTTKTTKTKAAADKEAVVVVKDGGGVGDKKLLTRDDLAKIISGSHDLSVAKSKRILDTLFQHVVEFVAEKKSVRISDFGTFSSYTFPARKGRNPSTGEALDIPAGERIRFKPFTAFKVAVQGNDADDDDEEEK